MLFERSAVLVIYTYCCLEAIIASNLHLGHSADTAQVYHTI